VSSSPKIESLHTNPDRVTRSILHGAPSSLVHRQMQHLADEVLAILLPHAEAAAEGEAERDAAPPPLPAPGIDVAAWLDLDGSSPAGDAGRPAQSAE
jgi:hypothetical protein